MRNTYVLPMLAAAALMLAAGCGGGSGSSGSSGAGPSGAAGTANSLGILGGTGNGTGLGTGSGSGSGAGSGSGSGSGGSTTSTASVQGIWSGTTTSSSSRGFGRASGAGNLEIDFSQTGTSLSGTAMLTQAPLFYSGAVSGTVSGSNATVTVDYGAFGKAVYSVVVSGGSITGSYILSAPGGGATIDSGTASLTAQPGLSTANITNTYNGTYKIGNAPVIRLAFYIIQNGDSFTVTSLLNGSATYVGTGTIIGNDIRFQANAQNGNGVIHVIGTVNGNTISGTMMEQGGGIGNSGDPVNSTFTTTVALHA